MPEPDIGEIRMFAGYFAPVGWELCEGQLLAKADYGALHDAIGTTYGGNATHFALPDLRGRVPVHQGSGPGLSPRTLGETGGAEEVTLDVTHLPSHSHLIRAAIAANSRNPQKHYPANSPERLYIFDLPSLVEMKSGAIEPAGAPAGSIQPHNNLQPYRCINFIIAVFQPSNPPPSGDPFLGEIRMFAGDFPPVGWSFCDGQLLSLSQNTALFALLGTNYGGNGMTNFALPNLAGSVPMHPGQGVGPQHFLGESGGAASEVLTLNQMPAHTHQLQGSTEAATTGNPDGAFYAVGRPDIYSGATPSGHMAASVVATAGAGQPHNNLQPYMTVRFIIARQGEFPQYPP